MINVENLKPFPKFCYTIGMIPTSYKVGLTYEEQLWWFCDFLQNTVIPTVNNNGLAVQELQNLYIELKSYVDNYFENLDVQTEINNKLDKMAESGQLADIIAQYIQLKGILAYNTVKEMKEAVNLVNGSFVKTYGFYSNNDNGGAFYKIRNITNQDVVDEHRLFALNNENLVAELITEDIINVKQLGFNENDTEENILNFLNNVLLENENYIFKNLNFKINNSFYPKSNTKFYFENCTILNNTETNQIRSFYIDGKNNIEFIGINTIFKFNKPETTQQAVFYIRNSKNIIIEGFELKDIGGDGIIILGTTNKGSENIKVNNCLINNARRNGISLTGGIFNINIINTEIKNTIGTDPQYGIDIETNDLLLYNEKIVIDNCYIHDNYAGAINIERGSRNVTIKNSNINGQIQGRTTIANGVESYPKLISIKNNYLNSIIGLKGLRNSQYIIKDNYFNEGRIYTENETDGTAITKAEKGSTKIVNNVFNNSITSPININFGCNVSVENNTINGSPLIAINVTNCYNINIINNIINDFAKDRTDDTTNAIKIQTSKNINILDNIIQDDNNITIKIQDLINIASSNSFVKLMNNLARGSFTNFINYVGFDTILALNNILENNLNGTLRNLPTPSAKYCGVILNTLENSILKPHICYYDTTTSSYKWKIIETS